MVMWTNTHCFDFFSCNLIHIVSMFAKLHTSSASPSIFINLFKVATYLSYMWRRLLIMYQIGKGASTQYKQK